MSDNELRSQFRSVRLTNGTRVSARASGRLGRAAVAIVYHAGSRSDPPGKAGLAHLTEHIILQSLTSADSIRSSLRNSARNWVAHTLTETVEFAFECDESHVETMLSLFTPPSILSRLNVDVLNRQRRVIYEELSRLETTDLAGGLFKNLPQVLFDDWAKRHDGFGTRRSLEGLNIEDVVSFVKKNFVPARRSVAIAARSVEDTFSTACLALAGEHPPSSHSEGPNRTVPFLDESAKQVDEDYRRAYIVGWRMPIDNEYENLVVATAVVALVNGVVAEHTDTLSAAGFIDVRANLGYFDPARASGPWVCSLVAHSSEGPAKDGRGTHLWKRVTEVILPAISRDRCRIAVESALEELDLSEYRPVDATLFEARSMMLGRGEPCSWGLSEVEVDKHADRVQKVLQMIPAQPHAVLP